MINVPSCTYSASMWMVFFFEKHGYATMVSLAMSALICLNDSVQDGVNLTGPFIVVPNLFNSVSGENISLHFGHKSQ